MPHRCCVPMCKTIGGHRFPRDPLRKAEWLKAIRRDNFRPDESARICKSHFVPLDYAKEQTSGARSLLNKIAVPSQFPWTSNPLLDDKAVRGQAKIQHKKIPDKRKLLLRKRSAAKKTKKDTMEGDEVNQDPSKNKCNEKLVKAIAQLENAVDQGANIMTDAKTDEEKRCSDETAECRACLQQLRLDRLFSLFQGWAPMWEGLGTTIAEDLTNLSDVQLSETDTHSKFICYTCCEKLWNACHFKMLVRDNDRILRQRVPDDPDRVWPKPIQVDKSISAFENNLPFNVDIKQEVLSDEEACNMEESYTDINLMDIKVEPEEIVEQPPILVNGVTSLKEFPPDDNTALLLNGETSNGEQRLQAVKEEPMSDNEDTGLPLECLLCMRPFHSMTGLKAHVIAQHSYQTVGRGSDERTNGDKHVCATCRRTFTTSTDLMVHETCHNKHVCYGCHAQFETFAKLSLHSKRCKALSHEATRPKTLDDVIRPQAEDGLPKDEKSGVTKDRKTSSAKDRKLFSCPLCNELFSDMYYVKIHQEVHHSKDMNADIKTDSPPMEIEMLENLFNEDT